jgi:hypothetical protein
VVVVVNVLLLLLGGKEPWGRLLRMHLLTAQHVQRVVLLMLYEGVWWWLVLMLRRVILQSAIDFMELDYYLIES